jgi:hypothetical protein
MPDVAGAHTDTAGVERTKGMWVVMDGRARLDTDAAIVCEVITTNGRRDQVPLKAARYCWRDHDAVLCFAPATSGRDVFGILEYVRDVD